jgi:hypothetical protein
MQLIHIKTQNQENKTPIQDCVFIDNSSTQADLQNKGALDYDLWH